jgi:hypothetical protein
MNRFLVLLLYALVGCALCGAVMAFASALVPIQTAMLIHAAAIPLIFGVLTLGYYSRQRYFDPFVVGFTFVAVALFMDVIVVAYFVLGSFEMFQSLLGVWIPLGLIFFSTYLAGLYATRRIPKKLDIFS